MPQYIFIQSSSNSKEFLELANLKQVLFQNNKSFFLLFCIAWLMLVLFQIKYVWCAEMCSDFIRLPKPRMHFSIMKQSVPFQSNPDCLFT